MFHNVHRKGHRYCTAVVTRDMTSTEIPRKIYDELLADLMKGPLSVWSGVSTTVVQLGSCTSTRYAHNASLVRYKVILINILAKNNPAPYN